MSDNNTVNTKQTRRGFLKLAGRLFSACAIGGISHRIFGSKSEESIFDQPLTRYAWQINQEKCTFCGNCQTACIRSVSAVKAVNDQKKCSNCVVCYGHITNKHVDSDKVDSEGIRVCVNDAVNRKNFAGGIDGTFLYTINEKDCTGCGKCVKRCNEHGSRSMFLLIRPDLCLGCNKCQISKSCPANAIERVPIDTEDDYRGIYGLDNMLGL